MCGRVVIDRDLEEIAEICGAAIHVAAGVRTGPRYNVPPTKPIRAVRLDPEGNRELISVHWGLIPSWSKEGLESRVGTNHIYFNEMLDGFADSNTIGDHFGSYAGIHLPSNC